MISEWQISEDLSMNKRTKSDLSGILYIERGVCGVTIMEIDTMPRVQILDDVLHLTYLGKV